MIRALKIILFYFLICFYSKAGHLYSQSALDENEMEAQYTEALNLLDRFQNEPAIKILESLENELISQKKLNTEFGYKVQDRFAEALEREDRDEEAITKLIKLIDETKENELWDVLANTQLSLARLHEKLGREERCIKYLRLAANVIEKYEVTEHYPRYNIRISSYHRIFGDRDSSMYYAKEAIRSSTELGQEDQIGTGHLLLGLLKHKDTYLEAVEHFETAGKIWYGLGDYSGYSYMQHNIARLHFDNESVDLAKIYNDSTFIAARATEKMGHDHRPILESAYELRSRLNEREGKLDSALINLKQANRLQLEIINSSNADKIAEIDGKYNDDLKTKTIEDQQQLLESERKRKGLLRVLFFVFLIFTAFLGFFYFRLLSALRRIKKQSSTIRKTNQKLSSSLSHSKVLQSELHHRVKNNLQTILGLIELQSKDIENPIIKERVQGMKQRIHGMAATHEAFNVDVEGETNVTNFLNTITDSFVALAQFDYPIRIIQEVKDFELNMETIVPLGMILNELLTNSVKHFSDAHSELIISIKLKKEDDLISLFYHDNGPGFGTDKMESREGGIGNYLINSMVRQLNGKWDTTNDDGAKVSILIKEKNKA